MATAWGRLLTFLSDEAPDEEEKAAAIEALALMCYQLDLTMLDWRISVGLALGAPLLSRIPAMEKKWLTEKPPERDMGPAVRVVPPQPTPSSSGGAP